MKQWCPAWVVGSENSHTVGCSRKCKRSSFVIKEEMSLRVFIPDHDGSLSLRKENELNARLSLSVKVNEKKMPWNDLRDSELPMLVFVIVLWIHHSCVSYNARGLAERGNVKCGEWRYRHLISIFTLITMLQTLDICCNFDRRTISKGEMFHNILSFTIYSGDRTNFTVSPCKLVER